MEGGGIVRREALKQSLRGIKDRITSHPFIAYFLCGLINSYLVTHASSCWFESQNNMPHRDRVTISEFNAQPSNIIFSLGEQTT